MKTMLSLSILGSQKSISLNIGKVKKNGYSLQNLFGHNFAFCFGITLIIWAAVAFKAGIC